MSITVVGSVALDTVETPAGRNEGGLGGAATYFSLAAVHYAPIHLVGVVGEDFPQAHVDLFHHCGVHLEGLERAPGRTFRWTGRYHDDVNERDTLETQLNVFENFHPRLPEAARRSPYLFLGNIHPSLQLEVLDQVNPTFTALDTMNLWIDIAQEDLRKVLARTDAIIINDAEVRLLTGRTNVIRGAREVGALGRASSSSKKASTAVSCLRTTPSFPRRPSPWKTSLIPPVQATPLREDSWGTLLGKTPWIWPPCAGRSFTVASSPRSLVKISAPARWSP